MLKQLRDSFLSHTHFLRAFKFKGLGYNAIVSTPASLAISATIGAAPVPVPPPIPLL
jgi:hypothetical protein